MFGISFQLIFIGVKLTDLHRENVDKVTIPSARPGMPPLKRITEVFDCWFESGSMPYAQVKNALFVTFDWLEATKHFHGYCCNTICEWMLRMKIFL